jgi:hypothetical protein
MDRITSLSLLMGLTLALPFLLYLATLLVLAGARRLGVRSARLDMLKRLIGAGD